MAKAADPAVISGYMGRGSEFDEAIGRFAHAYAEQNEADWAALIAAVNARRIQATRE
jgi:hypothetical protein